MIPILKLKLLKLRDEIKVIGLMTGLTFFMIAIFSSITYSESVVTFGFVDEDKSELSKMLSDEMHSKAGYELVEYSLDAAIQSVKENEVAGAIYVKKDFMAQILKGQPVEIEKLLVSENMSNIQMENLVDSSVKSIAYNYGLATTLSDFISHDEQVNQAVQFYVYDSLKEHWRYKKPMTVSEWKVDNELSYDSTKQMVIGFSLFFAMFTIVFGVAEILNERENNTWDRIIVSPISKLSLLMGNLGGSFIIGFSQVSLMFLIGQYVFKVNWQGRMVNTLIVIAAFVFCVTAMGMFIANFVKTIGQLSAITPIILTGTAMLGGCFWPLEIVRSKFLLFMANITPQKWAMASLKSIVVNGYGLEEAALGILVLIAMGIIYLTLGTLLLNKKTT